MASVSSEENFLGKYNYKCSFLRSNFWSVKKNVLENVFQASAFLGVVFLRFVRIPSFLNYNCSKFEFCAFSGLKVDSLGRLRKLNKNKKIFKLEYKNITRRNVVDSVLKNKKTSTNLFPSIWLVIEIYRFKFTHFFQFFNFYRRLQTL